MTIRITKLAVVARLIQLCLTGLCATGIRAAWTATLPVLVAKHGPQLTYRIPDQMDAGAALAVTCFCALGLVLVWGIGAIMDAVKQGG